jgi:hypothetical protein
MSNLRKPNGANLSRRKSGGEKKMAEKESASGVFENVTNLGAKLINIEGAKKFAAWYIDTAEKVANQAIDFQESATQWAKETPLAPKHNTSTARRPSSVRPMRPVRFGGSNSRDCAH